MANRTDPEAKTIHGTNPQVIAMYESFGSAVQSTHDKLYITELPLMSAEHGGKNSAHENL